MQHIFICYNRDIERRLLKTVDKVNGACHFDTLVSKWRMRFLFDIKKEQKMATRRSAYESLYYVYRKGQRRPQTQ